MTRKKIKFKVAGDQPAPLNALKIPKGGIKLKRNMTSDGHRRAKSKQAKESIYGLDVSFLKEIGEDGLVKVCERFLDIFFEEIGGF